MHCLTYRLLCFSASQQVKGGATLPALPNDRLLMQRLQPSYNVLSNIGRRQGHGQPLYAVGGIQRTAAEGFLQVSNLQDLQAAAAEKYLQERKGQEMLEAAQRFVQVSSLCGCMQQNHMTSHARALHPSRRAANAPDRAPEVLRLRLTSDLSCHACRTCDST